MLTQDLMPVEGMLINYSITTGTETEFKEQRRPSTSTYKAEHSQRREVSTMRKNGCVCVYRHIHLRSHFCKLDINFSIITVFKCSYRCILINEHKFLEKREKDTKQAVSMVPSGLRGRGEKVAHVCTHRHTCSHTMHIYAHITINKIVCDMNYRCAYICPK